MTERITVTLSDETTQMLNAYCNQRQMNKSSASAGLIVDGLEEWLSKQQQLGRATLTANQNFDFSIVMSGREVFGSNIENLLRREITGQLLAFSDKQARLLTALKNGLLGVQATLIPNGSFEKRTRAILTKHLYIYLLKTGFVQYVFNNGLTKDQQVEFSLYVANLTGFTMAQIPECRTDSNIQEKIVKLYDIAINDKSAMTPELFKQIKQFANTHKNGKIVVHGQIGTGKTTLATHIARDFNAEMILSSTEMRTDEDVYDVFMNDGLCVTKMHSNSQTNLVKRIIDMSTTHALPNGVITHDNDELVKRDVMFIELVRTTVNDEYDKPVLTTRAVNNVSYATVF